MEIGKINQNVSETSFVELIVIDEETTKTIKATCRQDGNGGLECDQGRPVENSVYEVAHNKIYSEYPKFKSKNTVDTTSIQSQKFTNEKLNIAVDSITPERIIKQTVLTDNLINGEFENLQNWTYNIINKEYLDEVYYGPGIKHNETNKNVDIYVNGDLSTTVSTEPGYELKFTFKVLNYNNFTGNNIGRIRLNISSASNPSIIDKIYKISTDYGITDQIANPLEFNDTVTEYLTSNGTLKITLSNLGNVTNNPYNYHTDKLITIDDVKLTQTRVICSNSEHGYELLYSDNESIGSLQLTTADRDWSLVKPNLFPRYTNTDSTTSANDVTVKTIIRHGNRNTKFGYVLNYDDVGRIGDIKNSKITVEKLNNGGTYNSKFIWTTYNNPKRNARIPQKDINYIIEEPTLRLAMTLDRDKPFSSNYVSSPYDNITEFMVLNSGWTTIDLQTALDDVLGSGNTIANRYTHDGYEYFEIEFTGIYAEQDMRMKLNEILYDSPFIEQQTPRPYWVRIEHHGWDEGTVNGDISAINTVNNYNSIGLKQLGGSYKCAWLINHEHADSGDIEIKIDNFTTTAVVNTRYFAFDSLYFKEAINNIDPSLINNFKIHLLSYQSFIIEFLDDNDHTVSIINSTFKYTVSDAPYYFVHVGMDYNAVDYSNIVYDYSRLLISYSPDVLETNIDSEITLRLWIMNSLGTGNVRYMSFKDYNYFEIETRGRFANQDTSLTLNRLGYKLCPISICGTNKYLKISKWTNRSINVIYDNSVPLSISDQQDLDNYSSSTDYFDYAAYMYAKDGVVQLGGSYSGLQKVTVNKNPNYGTFTLRLVSSDANGLFGSSVGIPYNADYADVDSSLSHLSYNNTTYTYKSYTRQNGWEYLIHSIALLNNDVSASVSYAIYVGSFIAASQFSVGDVALYFDSEDRVITGNSNVTLYRKAWVINNFEYYLSMFYTKSDHVSFTVNIYIPNKVSNGNYDWSLFKSFSNITSGSKVPVRFKFDDINYPFIESDRLDEFGNKLKSFDIMIELKIELSDPIDFTFDISSMTLCSISNTYSCDNSHINNFSFDKFIALESGGLGTPNGLILQSSSRCAPLISPLLCDKFLYAESYFTGLKPDSDVKIIIYVAELSKIDIFRKLTDLYFAVKINDNIIGNYSSNGSISINTRTDSDGIIKIRIEISENAALVISKIECCESDNNLIKYDLCNSIINPSIKMKFNGVPDRKIKIVGAMLRYRLRVKSEVRSKYAFEYVNIDQVPKGLRHTGGTCSNWIVGGTAHPISSSETDISATYAYRKQDNRDVIFKYNALNHNLKRTFENGGSFVLYQNLQNGDGFDFNNNKYQHSYVICSPNVSKSVNAINDELAIDFPSYDDQVTLNTANSQTNGEIEAWVLMRSPSKQYLEYYYNNLGNIAEDVIVESISLILGMRYEGDYEDHLCDGDSADYINVTLDYERYNGVNNISKSLKADIDLSEVYDDRYGRTPNMARWLETKFLLSTPISGLDKCSSNDGDNITNILSGSIGLNVSLSGNAVNKETCSASVVVENFGVPAEITVDGGVQADSLYYTFVSGNTGFIDGVLTFTAANTAITYNSISEMDFAEDDYKIIHKNSVANLVEKTMFEDHAVNNHMYDVLNINVNTNKLYVLKSPYLPDINNISDIVNSPSELYEISLSNSSSSKVLSSNSDFNYISNFTIDNLNNRIFFLASLIDVGLGVLSYGLYRLNMNDNTYSKLGDTSIRQSPSSFVYNEFDNCIYAISQSLLEDQIDNISSYVIKINMDTLDETILYKSSSRLLAIDIDKHDGIIFCTSAPYPNTYESAVINQYTQSPIDISAAPKLNMLLRINTDGSNAVELLKQGLKPNISSYPYNVHNDYVLTNSSCYSSSSFISVDYINKRLYMSSTLINATTGATNILSAILSSNYDCDEIQVIDGSVYRSNGFKRYRNVINNCKSSSNQSDIYNRKFKYTVINATSGSYDIIINFNNNTYIKSIPYNSPADYIRSRLYEIPDLYGNFTLTGVNPFYLEFSVDVEFTVDYSNLICNNLGHVDGGPYNYNVYDKLDGETPVILPKVPLSDSANVSKVLNVKRDLFDPKNNNTTVKSAARYKSVNIEFYTPFLRDYTTGVLTEIDYNYLMKNGDSVVLLQKGVNLNKATNYLKGSSNILPSRRSGN